jgi:hypothetical protein
MVINIIPDRAPQGGGAVQNTTVPCLNLSPKFLWHCCLLKDVTCYLSLSKPTCWHAAASCPDPSAC